MRGVVMAFAALWILAGSAHAEDARVATARAAYDRGEQERTIELVTPLLSTLGDRDRATALRLLGCAQMVLGDRAGAIAAFRRSFTLEPDAALEPRLGSSPDARSLFEVARGEWRAGLVAEMEAHTAEMKQLALAVESPARSRGGRPLSIGIKLVDPGQLVSRLELSYRRRGQATFTLLTERLERPLTGPIVFAIPADATETARPFVLEYHVTARHQTGFDLRRDGDPDHPRLIDVAPGHRPRWHESWLARGAIALGVVGLGAGGYLYYRSLDVGPQHVVVGSSR